MVESLWSHAPVRHVVMWNVAGDTVAERGAGIAAVKDAFEALRGNIPGMISLEIGIDRSGAPYACHMVLITEFESEAALTDYATHPAHLAVRDRLEGVCVARYQVDYACSTVEGR